jgi:hypothetical protein
VQLQGFDRLQLAAEESGSVVQLRKAEKEPDASSGRPPNNV